MEDSEEEDASAKEDAEEAAGGGEWCARGGCCVGRFVELRQRQRARGGTIHRSHGEVIGRGCYYEGNDEEADAKE